MSLYGGMLLKMWLQTLQNRRPNQSGLQQKTLPKHPQTNIIRIMRKRSKAMPASPTPVIPYQKHPKRLRPLASCHFPCIRNLPSCCSPPKSRRWDSWQDFLGFGARRRSRSQGRGDARASPTTWVDCSKHNNTASL